VSDTREARSSSGCRDAVSVRCCSRQKAQAPARRMDQAGSDINTLTHVNYAIDRQRSYFSERNIHVECRQCERPKGPKTRRGICQEICIEGDMPRENVSSVLKAGCLASGSRFNASSVAAAPSPASPACRLARRWSPSEGWPRYAACPARCDHTIPGRISVRVQPPCGFGVARRRALAHRLSASFKMPMQAVGWYSTRSNTMAPPTCIDAHTVCEPPFTGCCRARLGLRVSDVPARTAAEGPRSPCV
jgi:hypothetical protein